MDRSAVPYSVFIPYALDINNGLGVTVLISILLEHEKALAELRSKLKAREGQEGLGSI